MAGASGNPLSYQGSPPRREPPPPRSDGKEGFELILELIRIREVHPFKGPATDGYTFDMFITWLNDNGYDENKYNILEEGEILEGELPVLSHVDKEGCIREIGEFMREKMIEFKESHSRKD